MIDFDQTGFVGNLVCIICDSGLTGFESRLRYVLPLHWF
jgi:hypothetical protein